jgi:hypothetical protein
MTVNVNCSIGSTTKLCFKFDIKQIKKYSSYRDSQNYNIIDRRAKSASKKLTIKKFNSKNFKKGLTKNAAYSTVKKSDRSKIEEEDDFNDRTFRFDEESPEMMKIIPDEIGGFEPEISVRTSDEPIRLVLNRPDYHTTRIEFFVFKQNVFEDFEKSHKFFNKVKNFLMTKIGNLDDEFLWFDMLMMGPLVRRDIDKRKKARIFVRGFLIFFSFPFC